YPDRENNGYKSPRQDRTKNSNIKNGEEWNASLGNYNNKWGQVPRAKTKQEMSGPNIRGVVMLSPKLPIELIEHTINAEHKILAITKPTRVKSDCLQITQKESDKEVLHHIKWGQIPRAKIEQEMWQILIPN
ncbi:hypothetical protein ACJX0J_028910, partial [Zea mays]